MAESSLIIFVKSFILDVMQGSEFASDILQNHLVEMFHLQKHYLFRFFKQIFWESCIYCMYGICNTVWLFVNFGIETWELELELIFLYCHYLRFRKACGLQT